MRKLGIGLTFVLALAVATPASSMDTSFYDRSRKGTMSADLGMGFTLDETSFLMALEGAYFVHHNFSVGPLLQFGLDDAFFLLAPTANVKGIVDLPWMNSFAERTKPFGQMGLGLAFIDPDGFGSDTGFLLNFGMGGDYYISTNFTVGTSMMFNIMPADVLGQNFFFSWQVATVRYHF